MRKGVLLVTIVFIFFGCKKEEVNEFPFDSLIVHLPVYITTFQLNLQIVILYFFKEDFPNQLRISTL